MTAPTVPAGTPSSSRLQPADLLRSEFTKLRSVRSTYWTIVVATLASIAVGVLVCVQGRDNLLSGKDSPDGFDGTLTSINGLYLAQVAFGALGVLVITSEYGTGMIRASLAAVPRRRMFLLAKGTTLAACTLVAGEVLSFLSFGIGQAILAPTHASRSLSDPTALRAVVGGGLYLTAVALLGFGLGALIRHTAGALSAFFGVLFALDTLVNLLPDRWRNDIINYLPANAGSQIMTTVHTRLSLGPWTGFGVLCAYGAAAIFAAFVLVEIRDA